MSDNQRMFMRFLILIQFAIAVFAVYNEHWKMAATGCVTLLAMIAVLLTVQH